MRTRKIIANHIQQCWPIKEDREGNGKARETKAQRVSLYKTNNRKMTTAIEYLQNQPHQIHLSIHFERYKELPPTIRIELTEPKSVNFFLVPDNNAEAIKSYRPGPEP